MKQNRVVVQKGYDFFMFIGIYYLDLIRFGWFNSIETYLGLKIRRVFWGIFRRNDEY